MNLAVTFRGGLEASVLQSLERDGTITVVGVLVDPRDRTEAANVFPSARIHCVNDLFSAGLAGRFEDVDLRLLTPEILQATAWAAPIALAMMDRMDVHRSQTYKDRLQLFQYLLCYWQDVVNRDDVTCFYPRETPHEVADYVLFVVMKALGREVRMFAWTSFPGRWMLVDDYRYPRNVFEPPAGRGNEIDVDQFFDDYISAMRGSYEQAKPYYMNINLALGGHSKAPQPSLTSVVSGAISTTATYGFQGAKAMVQSYRSPPRKDYPRMPQALSRIGNSWQVAYDAKRLRAFYENLATVNVVPTNRNFVYYLPGYQPEVTNCPEGGFLGDQILAISLLAKSLPEGWEVLVKEHPVQFANGASGIDDYGFLGRQTSFYSAIADIKGVRLVSVASDHFGMLDAARVVSTLTGTGGWEASVRGKPVFSLGEAWYRDAPNVFAVRDSASCAEAYRRVIAGEYLTGEKLDIELRTFVTGIWDSSYEIVFDEIDGKVNGITFDKAILRAHLKSVFVLGARGEG
jgi:hypothetical protein